ncbi:MAG: hypothetical protein WC916_00785 [Candidatus Woesearchaeota archaeon]
MVDINILISEYLAYFRNAVETSIGDKLSSFTFTEYAKKDFGIKWNNHLESKTNEEFVNNFLHGNFLAFDIIIDCVLASYKQENIANDARISEEIIVKRNAVHPLNTGNNFMFLNNFTHYFTGPWTDWYIDHVDKQAFDLHRNRYIVSSEEGLPGAFYHARWKSLKNSADGFVKQEEKTSAWIEQNCAQGVWYPRNQEADLLTQKIYTHLRKQGFTIHDICA